MRAHARFLLALAVLVAACSGGAFAPRDASESGIAPITAEAVRAHVEVLASPRLEGRLTGTEGERVATRYVAERFAAAGLVPGAPDGSWFHAFEFTAGTSLGRGNALRRSGAPRAYALERDWRPVAFSRNGDAANVPVVFAGYGLVAPAADGAAAYDSYAGLDVRDKLVLVLRYAPQDVAPEQRQHLMRYASLRHKAMLARDRGALGVLIATGPRSPVREQLVPLRNDAAVGATSVFVLSLTNELAASWLKDAGRDLDALQQTLDAGAPAPGFALPGLALDLRVDLVQVRRSGRNVLGRLRTARGAGAEPVLVGAHVDHLGRGGPGSLARDDEQGQVHPGADDNASGVAALIEIARQLAAEERAYPGSFARDLLFAAWSGEEIGLVGSAAYAREFPVATALAHGAARPLAAVLNLDMVGRLRDALTIQGGGSSPIWNELVERANAPLALPVRLQSDSYLPTDSTSFHLKGIPVLSFFTGGHAEYHTPRDTADTLDYAGLASVAELVASIAAEAAQETELPVRLAPAQPELLGPRAGLRAYLGTIPHYGEGETGGVTLSGVAPGGPAERAGIRAGDRVVELAGQKIENIYDYTYALDAVAIGKPVPIVVERAGARLTLTITPSSRD